MCVSLFNTGLQYFTQALDGMDTLSVFDYMQQVHYLFNTALLDAVIYNLAPLQDDTGEDFTTELDAVEDTGSGSDGDSEGGSTSDARSDLGTMRRILTIPRPDAPMHEVHKALEIAQPAYNAVRSKLQTLKKDYVVLQAAVPARSHNKVLKKTSALDSQISHTGKKYAMFHYFWVMNGLFPTTSQPNIDPRSDTCWASPEAKLNGAMAELYHFWIPVSSERSNILHSLKDCAGLIFSNLKLDPTIFTARSTEKKENKQLVTLLKKHGEDEYTRLAPVLFTNPSVMVPDDFLKTPVMVKLLFDPKGFLDQAQGSEKRKYDRKLLKTLTPTGNW
ncbi:uncharacterized protein HD556DRAFT_1533646 [Suillus plorans]|uniref:Uncharacterized protein n=1 Tax=Suillus plorans TaxID=116603 RepID=A0A9P7DSS1_9AGAM|nr:uncharacterized protein HD556DRAFT_1533646 [Suillus plorans]KAG1802205.1 hypothetical protein HD556DRAFT_1533646 [Suillus plorans]